MREIIHLNMGKIKSKDTELFVDFGFFLVRKLGNFREKLGKGVNLSFSLAALNSYKLNESHAVTA